MNKQLIYLLTSAAIFSSLPSWSQADAYHHKIVKAVPVGCPVASPVHRHRKPVVPKTETIVVNSSRTTAVVVFNKGRLFVNDSQVATVRHPGYDDYTVRVNYIVPPAPESMERVNTFPGFEAGKPLLGVVTCNSCRDGATVEEVISCSPAEKAGLEEGDVIVMINDHEINNKEQLAAAIADYKVGDDVTVTYRRCGMQHAASAELGNKHDVENSACNGESFSDCGGCYSMRSRW